MFSFLFFFFFNPWQILSFMSSQQMKTRQEWTDLNRGGAGGLMPKGLNSLKDIKEQWAAGNPFKTDSVEV